MRSCESDVDMYHSAVTTSVPFRMVLPPATLHSAGLARCAVDLVLSSQYLLAPRLSKEAYAA